MIFNVGARRSGTYWLQRIVCAHPAVAEVPTETHLFSHGIAPLLERFQHDDPAVREVGQVYVDRKALIEDVRALSDGVFEQFAGDGQTHIAERTPLHVLHVPLIAEVYPAARFVHIIRDGRDAVRSLVAQEWGPSTVSEAAEEWRSCVEAGRLAQGLLPGRVLVVRYEALLAEPRQGIGKIYPHLGLEGSLDAALDAAGRVENLGGHDRRIGAGKWRDGWGKRELRDFDQVAGDLLRELGYVQ